MSELKVTRIDSPLARTRDSLESDGSAGAPPRMSDPPTRPRALHPSPQRLPHSHGHDAQPEVPAPRASDPQRTSLRKLPEPPSLDEEFTLLSARVPRSLRAQLAAHTAALRVRAGEHVSQKALPEQEVLAVALWLLGSPKDPVALEALAHSFDHYRARRHVAAARNLVGDELVEEPDGSDLPL